MILQGIYANQALATTLLGGRAAPCRAPGTAWAISHPLAGRSFKLLDE